MNNACPKPVPGEVWWAWQLFFTNPGTRIERNKGTKYGVAHIPVTQHPALVLAPGDDKELGYLVCFFSTKEGDARNPSTARIGDIFNNGQNSYLIKTAPNYCSSDFIENQFFDKKCKPVIADPNLLKYACDQMTWATRVRKGQSPGIVLADVLCEWFTKLPSEAKRHESESIPEAVLDDVITDVR